ncbi:MAG: hypothetical protein RLZZ324_531 [Candidatus Parcubacteria bacterium]|jgi:hypothetical protein
MTVSIDLASAGQTIIVVLFGICIVAIAVMLWKKVLGFFRGRAFDGTDRENMRRRWVEIEKAMETPGEMGKKLAIIEADKLLDTALKSLSMAGETLGERLKFAQYKYPELRDVWPAHRVRNQLAHEASYHLDTGTARRSLKQFRSALERLGAL